jgi:DNA-binding XRE family transcriptional regulator
MPRNASGYIYAIGTPGESYVKVGSTQSPIIKRLRALQVAHPYPLEVFALVPVDENMQAIERLIHQFLANERGHLTGEWFEGRLNETQLTDFVVRAVQYIAEQETKKRQQELSLESYGNPRMLGERLRVFRTRREWSQQELAARSGVPYMTIYRLEEGIYEDTRCAVAGKLSKALGISLDFFVGMYESNARNTIESS